jgi:protein translocase SecG subunit
MHIAQILVSMLLVATILLQVRGEGSGMFGSAQSSFRVRTGVELLLFRFTIVLVVVFLAISIVSVRFSRF